MRITTQKTPRSNCRQRVATVATLFLFLSAVAFHRIRPSRPSQMKGGAGGPDGRYHYLTCNASGECGENPSVPSPRTPRSAKSREEYDLWWTAHAALKRSADEYAARRRSSAVPAAADGDGDAKRRRPLVLLGDSITESWLGTNMGEPCNRTEGVPEVMREFAGRNDLDPLVLAIGGDQTQHLLWRIQNGELLPQFADDPDAIFILLIGTNNLGRGFPPEPTVSGAMSVAEYVLSHTRGRLVQVMLLPRGDVFRLRWLCPPRCDSSGEPLASFMPTIEKVNLGMKRAATGLGERYGSRYNLIDCGKDFLSDEEESRRALSLGSEVREDVMPDLLHPNAEGHNKLAKCLFAGINESKR